MIWGERESRPKTSGLVRCSVKLPGVRKEAEEQRSRVTDVAEEVPIHSRPVKSTIPNRKQTFLRALIRNGRYEISPPALPLFQAHYNKKKSLTRISGAKRHSPARQSYHTPSTSIFRQSAYPIGLSNPSLRSYSSGASLLACPAPFGQVLKQHFTGREPSRSRETRPIPSD